MNNFNIIAAVDLNGVIGDSRSNSIPWRISADLKTFKRTTLNKTVIMGSNTLKSIGHGLPNRRNVVISSDTSIVNKYENVDACYSNLIDAYLLEKENSFIIGGARLYLEALDLFPKKFFITIVNKRVVGDVVFPIPGYAFLENNVKISNGSEYDCASRSKWFMENDYEYQFTEFERRN